MQKEVNTKAMLQVAWQCRMTALLPPAVTLLPSIFHVACEHTAGMLGVTHS